MPETIVYLNWPPETAETITDAIMEKLQRQPGETLAASGVAKRGISRRTAILLGMAALGTVAAGVTSGSLIWLARSHSPSAPTVTSIGTLLYTYRGHSLGVMTAA